MSAAKPINILRIDHVVLRVRDLSRMIGFYRAALGCELERGPGDEGLAQLRAGESLIDLVAIDSVLGRQSGGDPTPDAPNVDHVCLLIDPWDETAILAQLRRNGVDPGSTELRYGATGFGPSVYFRDPEGNTIELKGRS
ncbi:MAG: VOC family protein [Pseudomonadota bacterium]